MCAQLYSRDFFFFSSRRRHTRYCRDWSSDVCSSDLGVINGRFYLVGGFDHTPGSSSTLEVYNPATNTWTPRAPIPTALHGAAGSVIGGRLYVVGGAGAGGLLNTVHIYNPGTNSWTTGAAMPTPRSFLGAAAANGILYAIGGNSGARLRTNEAYTP